MPLAFSYHEVNWYFYEGRLVVEYIFMKARQAERESGSIPSWVFRLVRERKSDLL